jgi:transketolase
MSLADADMRDAFFDGVYDLAVQDPDLVFLTADHGAFSLERFRKDIPRQYFNVGIAEQNMVSVAAGLALSGKRVFIYSIIDFVTLRCIEQINVDIGGMNLPVVIVGVGAGFTYSTDGPTHHGTQDIAAMASIPNLAIFNCSDAVNSQAFARMAYARKGPSYVRIEKGKFPLLYQQDQADFSSGFRVLKTGRDGIIVTSGYLVHTAMAAAQRLRSEGLDVGVLDLYRVKPMNVGALTAELKPLSSVIVLEDNILTGGIGSMIGTAMSESGSHARLKRMAINDEHCFRYGDREWMYASYGLDAESVQQVAREFISTAVV